MIPRPAISTLFPYTTLFRSTPKLDWDTIKEFAKWVAERLVKAYPDRFTSNMAKRARTGRIFIDYLRNGRGATAIGAYSRSEEHTSELQSHSDLVCRLLLEKK